MEAGIKPSSSDSLPFKRSILFVLSIYNYHREVEPVVREFARAGWRVTVIIGWLGTTADTAALVYEALDCRVIRLPSGIGYAPQTPVAEITRSARPHPSLAVRLARGARSFVSILKLRQKMAAIIDDVSPNAVFMGPFHSCGTFDNALFVSVRRRAIPVFCYPVSSYHGRIFAISARFTNLHSGMCPPVLNTNYDLLNRVAARLFPKWCQERDGERIFMWDPVVAFAARLAGVLGADVWQKPEPGFDAVFVFSEYSRSLLVASEYDPAAIRVIGIPLLDSVFDKLNDPWHRAGLFAALNINPAGGFILFNVEPSVEHRYADAEAHWERFDGMMRAVTGHGVAVVLSLHPLCDPRDYAFAEQRYGVVLARSHKIYDLYPYCRLAVSYPCSTNVVSELFRKDLVLYDFSGLAAVGSAHASEFRLPWARVVNSFDEARAAIIDALREGAQTSVAVDKPAAASAMVRRYVDEISADRQLRSTSRGTRGRIDPVAACRSAQTSSLIGRVLDLLREKVVRPD